jgi:hypothetical protein
VRCGLVGITWLVAASLGSAGCSLFLDSGDDGNDTPRDPPGSLDGGVNGPDAGSAEDFELRININVGDSSNPDIRVDVAEVDGDVFETCDPPGCSVLTGRSVELSALPDFEFQAWMVTGQCLTKDDDSDAIIEVSLSGNCAAYVVFGDGPAPF